MEKKTIVATLENFDGLSELVASKLKKKRYFKDQAFEVVELKDGVAVIKSARFGETDTFEVGLENLRFFEKFGDDYKVYEPTEEEKSSPKEKCE